MTAVANYCGRWRLMRLVGAGQLWIVDNITQHPEVSASVWTQTTDVEDECDGLLNYDRTHKLSPAQQARIRDANLRLIGKPRKADPGIEAQALSGRDP